MDRSLTKVACRICGNGTEMMGTRLCDPCWELETRITANPEIARQILSECEGEGGFINEFNMMIGRIHEWATEKGFWEAGVDRNDGEMIALMHSELSEALEAIRAGNPPDDKIPDFSGYEAELADCIIRIMDVAAARGLKVAEAIIAKMAYNKNRPYKHGKEF